MSDAPENSGVCPFTGHAIIAGFGVPGRAVAELLEARNVPFCVIELNPKTVDRCSDNGMHMIAGDVADEQTLQRAGIERAVLFAIAIPNEAAALEAVRLARGMNSKLHIMARCHFISAGIEAHRRGANDVLIEEMIVGQEFVRLLEEGVAPLGAVRIPDEDVAGNSRAK